MIIKLRSISVNMSWAALGQISYSLSQYLIVLTLAKLDGASSVGLLTLAFSIIAPIIMFSNLRMHLLLSSDVRHDYTFTDYFILRLSTALIALLSIVLLSFCIVAMKNQFVIIFIGFAKVFEAISDICYALIRQYTNVIYIALSQILKSVLMVISFSSAIYLTHNLNIGCLCIALSWFLVLIELSPATAPNGIPI